MARRQINIETLPSNDRDPTSREVDVVTEGRVRTRKHKKNLASEVRNIGRGLFDEIMLPMIKNLIFDSFMSGLGQVLGLKSQPTSSGHTSYNSIYRGSRGRARSNVTPVKRPRYIEEPLFEDIYFEIRADANLVLGRMMELITDYGQATIGDLYALTGITANVTHERWGWVDLHKCQVIYTTEGFVIDFPDPIDLK